MKPIATLALTLMLPAAAIAQQQEPRDAWQTFLAANGAGFTAEWNPATGTPNAIFGNGLKVADELETVEAARVQSERVLAQHAALLGTGSSRLVEQNAARARHLFYFVYGQQYRGLDVIGARADVRLHELGIVAMFGASLVQIPAGFAIAPQVAAADAQKTAAEHVLGGAARGETAAPRLVIWAEPFGKVPTQPVLAWEVQIDEQPHAMVVGKVYVDARTRAVLAFENEVHYCTTCDKSMVSRSGGSARTTRAERAMARRESMATAPGKPAVDLTGTVMGFVVTGHAPTDPLVNVPLANLQVTSSAGNAYTDAQGNFSIPYTGTTPVVVSATLTGRHCQRVRVNNGTQLSGSQTITPGTPATIQIGTTTMGDDGKGQTNAYYFVNAINEWGRTHVLNQPSQWTQLDTMNPLVNIPSSCNATYSGMTINHYASSATCNMTGYEMVIYHEWGHGFDDAWGGIRTTDGLSEGWADVVAILLAQYHILGDKFYKSQTPDYVRIATNTRTYPTTGGTHMQGEVWMGWTWDVRTDMVARYGQTLGQKFTEDMIVPTIVANAATLPAQIREVFLLDDDDANLNNGTPNYTSLEKACLKRTIPFPKIDVGTVSHTPLKGTDQQLTPRVVLAKAPPIIGTFTKVEMVYDIGAGPQRREMVPTANKDEYVALLPGVLSPVDVSYHIEATHATSKVIRFPEVGEFGYSVGREDIFWSDDFEKGANGWTAGPLFGSVNDFQLGRPTGASGTSWGTGWRDPNGAFSGNSAWGNNLNGAYALQYAARLRSPVLDLTGKTNVKLRFMRWLQVQDGRYDVARVLVNNSSVWSNPWGSDLVDSGWNKFELAIPAANNNSAVQLEWQMVTDGGKELAGWNIDDVTLFSFQALPAPAFQFVVEPAQVDLGKGSNATLKGTANAPILMLFSNSEGPMQVPGLPLLHIGTPFVPYAARLNATGELKFAFTAPTSTSATGELIYGQALEQTTATTITASNPIVVLWGK